MLNLDMRFLPRAKGRMLTVFAMPALVLLFLCFPLFQIHAVKVAATAGSAVATLNPGQALSPISIDYPEDGSIFPPGITPPTFLWRDAAGTPWSIDVSFPGKWLPRAFTCWRRGRGCASAQSTANALRIPRTSPS